MSPRPRLPLERGTLVIGDLHLDVGAGAEATHGLTAGFLSWLAGLDPGGSPAVPRLIVLGDLFDAWIGPAQMELPAARAVVEGLAAATGRGLAIDVIPGNRDFLLEGAFERASGARVWPVGLVGELDETRVLLIHGDELCSEDRAYQRLRRVLRSRPVLGLAPRLPRPLALAVARRLRRASVRALAVKPAAEKEQKEPAVRLEAERDSSATLICGHAHRFRDESLVGGPRWIVVGAFGGPQDVLRLGPGAAVEASSSGAGSSSGGTPVRGLPKRGAGPRS